MGNVQPMGNNSEIAEHGTIFQKQLLAQEDIKGLEGIVIVHQEVAEQYKSVSLHPQKGQQWH